jgi:hypothetical protein
MSRFIAALLIAAVGGGFTIAAHTSAGHGSAGLMALGAAAYAVASAVLCAPLFRTRTTR